MTYLIDKIKMRIGASKFGNRLAHGAAWSIGGSVVERLATLLLTVLMVRALGREAYGEFTLIQSTISMFAVFASMGISVTGTKYTAQLKDSDIQKLSEILSFLNHFILIGALIICGGIMLGAGFIAEKALDTPKLSSLLMLASVALFFNTLNGFQSGCLIGLEELKKNAIAACSAAILAIPLTVVLARWAGIQGVVWTLVLTALMRWLLSHWFLSSARKKWHLPKLAKYKRDWRVITDFAFPALLSGLMLAPAHWICHAMLANSSGGKSEMALIGIANQWFYALMFLPVAANRVVLPLLADSSLSSNQKNTVGILKLSLISNIVFALPVVLLISALSPYVMSVYGAEYANHWSVLVLALVAGFFSVLSMPLGQLIAARGRMWIGLGINAVWAASYITLSWLMIDHGASGVLSALTIAYLLHIGWSAVICKQLINNV